MKRKGIFIVLVGPDGTGKSTIAEAISARIGSRFDGTSRFHWRPGLLPTPGRGTKPGDAPAGAAMDRSPPTEYKYGVAISLLRYLYFLVDFVIGYWLRLWPKLLKGEMIIGERWYYDVVVHPQRYAFKLPGWLLRLGGFFVPKPDVSILLYGDPDRIHARKPELPPAEIRRHIVELENTLPSGPGSLCVATDTEIADTLASIFAHIDSISLDIPPRAPIWSLFPTRGRARLYIGDNDRIANALNAYQAHSSLAKALKALFLQLPEPLARRLLPKQSASVRANDLRNILGSLKDQPDLSECAHSAYVGSAGSNQKLTIQLSHNGRPAYYAKCGWSADAQATLAQEAAALNRLVGAGNRPFEAPELAHDLKLADYRILVTTAAEMPYHTRGTEPDQRDMAFLGWMAGQHRAGTSVRDLLGRSEYHTTTLPDAEMEAGIDDHVCAVAIRYLREQVGDQSITTHACHGDYAPWNTLLPPSGRLYIFDWEYYRTDAPAFTDLLHFAYMPHRLIKKTGPACAADELLSLIEQPDIVRLAASCGVAAQQFPVYVALYLIGQSLRERREQGRTSTYTIACLRRVLSSAGHVEARRRMLVSAYACEPNEGSEPGVGWNWVQLIAQSNEAWVLTKGNNRNAINEYLSDHPIANLHFEYVDVPKWLSFWKKGQRGIRTYYYLWQFFAYLKARRLHREIGFDLAHHVTFVNDWLWTFLCLLPIPYIWGPIGSHPFSPACLLANRKALIKERLRTGIQTFMRIADPLYWLSALRASRIVAINRETANVAPLRWIASSKIVIEPAIGMEPVTDGETRGNRNDAFTILFVGRFAPIKAPHIAVEAFAEFLKRYPGNATLRMIGKGDQLTELHSRIQQYGIGDHVEIIDWIPRDDVIHTMETADIFLFPSMECGGMVVLEAMASGLPVVCLAYGGPGEMVDDSCGYRIPIGDCDPNRIRSALADAMLKLTDPEFRDIMGTAARRRVAERYYWDNKLRFISNIYKETPADTCMQDAHAPD